MKQLIRSFVKKASRSSDLSSYFHIEVPEWAIGITVSVTTRLYITTKSDCYLTEYILLHLLALLIVV